MSRTRAALLAPALTLALLAGCATNPVTGERELMLVSERQEADLGRDGDREVVAQYGVVEDPALQRYVEELGQRLVAVSHRPNMSFTFRVLDDPVVNAFALPGGFVYVTRGILPYLQREGALALVLGHEVGHVTARHGAQRLTRQHLLGLGIGVSSLLGERFAVVTGLASAGGQLLLLSYGRDDERQSDQLGVTYGTRAGFDTSDGAAFFEALQRLSGDRGALPSWASTHPDPGERSETVRRLSREARREAGAAPPPGDREAFLRRLEGLVFGQDPRQGYIERGWLNHPDLRLRFPIPGGWRVHNMASQVQLTSSDGKRAMIMAIVAAATPTEAADRFEDQEEVSVHDRADLQLNGFTATRLTATIRTAGGEVGALSTFVAKDGRVFAFHGLAEPPDMPEARQTLAAIAEGFEALTDPQALAMQPAVLHVVEASRTATFRELASEWPLPEGVSLGLEGLALINGIGPDETVTRGTLLKVLRRRN